MLLSNLGIYDFVTFIMDVADFSLDFDLILHTNGFGLVYEGRNMVNRDVVPKMKKKKNTLHGFVIHNILLEHY